MQTVNVCDSLKSHRHYDSLNDRSKERNLKLDLALSDIISEFAKGFGFSFNHPDFGQGTLEFFCEGMDEAFFVIDQIKDRLWNSLTYKEVNDLGDIRIYEDPKHWFYKLEFLQDGPLVVLKIDVLPYAVGLRRPEDPYGEVTKENCAAVLPF